MCGIAGIIDPRLGREEGETLLEKMLHSIRHRGPDYSSSWVEMPVLLGHNRLSIIDLSDRANQPMIYDGLVIVYNGEVYNYLEIKEELEERGYKFRTTSDTEVILAAYREWGSDCVARFLGMWAFAIWDTAKKELFCSRDRFGIKPFYYIHAGDRFYFGSEYAPLKLSPIFNSTFDLGQISRGLRLNIACYRDDTYFKCLKALPERCNLVFKNGTVSVTPYWDIDGASKFRGTFEEKKERFRELFRDSVRLHMRSDVEVGGMLSGGMDSSSIASVVGVDFPTVPFKTFTIYYKGRGQMDERAWAREVVSAYPNLEPTYYAPSDQEVIECFDTASKASDVPMMSSPGLSTYFVMKLAAKRKIKVLLSGDGADEYLAGYWPAYDRLIGGQIKRGRWLRALNSLQEIRRHKSLDFASTGLLGLQSVAVALLSEEAIWRGRSRLQFARVTTDKKGASHHQKMIHGSRLDRYLYRSLFYTFLPGFLHCTDRMSMAFSIECRVPFLDHRLVEFAFALDDEVKIRDGQSKYILRKSMEGIVPQAILSRREKQPFVGEEMASWLAGPLKHLIERPMRFDGIEIINEREASRVVRDFKEGDRSKTWLVWRLATLNFWSACQ
jgi:asparagine synthase (glutamine-hydrolysing)